MGDTMVNRPRDFRHHDVVRAFRAAQAAGIANPSVRIRGPSGTEYYVGGGEVAVPKPKKSVARNTPFAKGGDSDAMAGKGDRTTTSSADSANPQRPGSTGHRTGGDAKKLAKGGEVGGVARKALPGRCGT